MIHLGDITKISGYEAPTVDVIVGGSPCQDLSIAGKRAGLDGERSGLFMEQIRIIKEMRERDVQCGRTDVDIRPRYMVWENVPGAFSSNKGEDFRVVLEETAKVCDKDASIPMPNNGKWTTSGCILGNGWSIAWRVLDAQFWGVPQRRRRIALVADFGGHSAPEILFVRKSLSGDTEQSKPQRKTIASDATGCTGADDCIGVDVYNALLLGNKVNTLVAAGNNSTGFSPKVMVPIQCIDQGGGKSACNVQEGKAPTLTCTHGGEPVVALDRASYNQGQNAQFDIGVDDKGIAQSLVAKGPGAVCYGIGAYHSNAWKSDNPHSGVYEADTAKTLDALNCGYPACNQGGMAVVQQDIAAVDCRNGTENSAVNGTLQSHMGCGSSLNLNNVVRTRYTVRRLTPLECERLQGYPDNWTLIGEPIEKVVEEFDEDTGEKEGEHIEKEFYYTNLQGKRVKASDAARYKALGNSIAIPPWKWVMKRLCACYERDATLASLFDGIGGFPLIWEQLNGKGSCLWASEIEEFPIAVTKKRIGG